MTFQSNIPLPGDLISVSQGDLKNNFGALNTAWNANHIDFNTSGGGKHKFAEFPNQGSDPAGAATEITLFSKLASSASQLFYKRDNAGSSFQLTGRDPTGTTNGTTFLPGGYILIWGAEASVANNTPKNFHTAFPNNCFFVAPILNSATDQVAISLSAFNKTNFTIKFTAAGNIPVVYAAIGN